ncbi:integrase, catalytic region, zinc finger, CCHC-type containing protein [Tanacetum coccineum]
MTAVKLNRGLKESIYDQLYAYLKQHEAYANENKMIGQGNNPRGAGAAGHIARNCTQPKRPHNSDYFKDKMLLMQAQENGVVLDEEQLLFLLGGQDTAVDEDVNELPVQDLALNVDNVFQADECDAFDSDVDEAPTTQTIFMTNLSSADPVYDEAGPSYDSDILSEVHEYDNYQDAVCEHHEVHEMHDDVQPNYVVDSHADYTSDINMILYDQYVKDNAVPVVQSNVSSVPNDAYMIIINEMHEHATQCVSVKAQNKVVDASLIAELATYKEQLYERRAMFELIDIEQKIEEQLRIVIADHYSKENYLATFTPQTQLTPGQIFWSKDVLKMKAEALKEQTIASRPIKALTVYPPNMPATLRITPTGLTEEERGFEQTKECYIIEVIPFFKTLKEHFKGKALTKEIKEMKEIFEELEAEVDQNVVNRKFTEMHDAHIVVQACCLELEAELYKLHDKLKYQHLKESFGNNTSPPARDAPDFDLTRSEANRTLDFRALDFQITQLTEKVIVLQEQNELFRAENAKIKQDYKELYDSIKITRAKHIKQTTTLLTENENMKAQIHENLKCITMNSVKPRVLSPGRYAIDVEPIHPHSRNNREVHLYYLKHLKENVETLCEIVEEAKVEKPLDRSLASACLYTKHSQELLEYVIGTCPKDFNKQDKKHASTPLTRKKQVTFEDNLNSCTDASGSKPRSNTKKNMISSAKSVNKKKVEEHPRINKFSLKTTNRVNYSIRSKRTVVQIILWYLDIGCSKHMTGDRSRLKNFVKKFIGTVRFGNDDFGAIMGYGDYVIGDSVISRHSCYVRDTDGVELIKGSRGSNLYTISVEDMMKSSSICLLSKASKNKSWLWHRRLNHLNFGTINDLARKNLVRVLPRLKFQKDHLCYACQLVKSKKHTHTPKTENTNLEVLNTLHMDLCGPMRVQTINGRNTIFSHLVVDLF